MEKPEFKQRWEEFVLWYWDDRGAWREWGTYTKVSEAKEAIGTVKAYGGAYRLEQRTCVIAERSAE